MPLFTRMAAVRTAETVLGQSWFFHLLLTFRSPRDRVALVRVSKTCKRLGRQQPIGDVRVLPLDIDAELAQIGLYWRLTVLHRYSAEWLERAALRVPDRLAHVTDLSADAECYATASQVLPSLRALSLTWGKPRPASRLDLDTAVSSKLVKLELQDGYWPLRVSLAGTAGLAGLRELHLPFHPHHMEVLDRLAELTTLSCLLRGDYVALGGAEWPAWLTESPVKALRVDIGSQAQGLDNLSLVGLGHQLEDLSIVNACAKLMDGSGLSVCTRLRKVHLVGMSNVQLSQSFSTLRDIGLARCSLPLDSLPDARCGDSLETLRLVGVRPADAFGPLDVAALRKLRTLCASGGVCVGLPTPFESATIEVLEVENTPSFRVAELEFGAAPNLRELTLSNARATMVARCSRQEEEAEGVAAAPMTLPALRSLTLLGSRSGHELVKELFAQHHCPNLQALHDHQWKFMPCSTWSDAAARGLAALNITQLTCVAQRAPLVAWLECLPNLVNLELIVAKIVELPGVMRVKALQEASNLKRVTWRVHHDHASEAAREYGRAACVEVRVLSRRFHTCVREPVSGAINCERCWFVPLLLHAPLAGEWGGRE